MKKLFTRTMLLLCALIAGSGSVWALDTYKKVTSDSEIAEGKEYVLVCESKNVAMAIYKSGTYCAGVNVTISNNNVTAVENINVLTFEQGSDGWYIKQENGNYLYSSAAKNLKAENKTDKSQCTITNDFQIKMGSNGILQYNASSPRFCPYTSTQTTAYLYVKDEAEASPLSSISVSGSFATEFSQGEEFNHTGAIVTATYENGNTAVVTSSATFSTPEMNTTGTKIVTVSYTEGNVTKTTTYNITIKEFVQPTDVNITLINSFFGSDGTGNVDNVSLEGHKDRVSVSIAKNDGNKLYVNAEQIRLYNKNTMVITAPSGYVVTSAEFIEPSTGKAWAGTHTSSPNGYDSESKKWTGASNTVTITFGGTCRMVGLNVTLAQIATITLAYACTDGTKYYGTYSNSSAFVVPADLTVSEISVSSGKLQVSNYATGAIVPANTGVMVSSTTAGDHTILLSNEPGTSVPGTDNMLKPSSEEMTGDYLFYRLTMHNGETIGFWWGAAEGAAFSIAANKAYLAVPQSLARQGFAFADEATGIEASQTCSNEARGEVYNLQGQRVKKAQKGLYIVNGKKFINK